MRCAGFRYVLLGIENILEGDPKFLRVAAKNTARENGSNNGECHVSRRTVVSSPPWLVQIVCRVCGHSHSSSESRLCSLRQTRPLVPPSLQWVPWPFLAECLRFPTFTRIMGS